MEKFTEIKLEGCNKTTPYPNYEELDIDDEIPSNEASTAIMPNKSMENFSQNTSGKLSSIESFTQQDVMSTTNAQEMFKNIPVRPRKGAIPHMENYHLFDPAVDFCNEKELRLRNFTIMQSLADFHYPIKNVVHQQKQPQQKRKSRHDYDISEHDERLKYHNYYEIDPDLLDAADGLVIDHNRIEGNSKLTAAELKCCDLNSVSAIEKPHSSNESTVKERERFVGISPALEVCKNTSRTRSTINQTSTLSVDDDTNVIAIVSSTRKKDSRVVLNPITRNSSNDAIRIQDKALASLMTDYNTNFSLNDKSFPLNSLKSSHSLPQLDTIGIQQRFNGDYNLEVNNRAIIQLRKKSINKTRPLSSDSGLVTSPTTTPSPPNEICTSNNTTNSSNGSSSGDDYNQVNLRKCKNLTELIEVSFEGGRLNS